MVTRRRAVAFENTHLYVPFLTGRADKVHVGRLSGNAFQFNNRGFMAIILKCCNLYWGRKKNAENFYCVLTLRPK